MNFMEFYIFIYIIKEIEFRYKFVSSNKYDNKCSTLNILHIFAYYIYVFCEFLEF